jgi:hypothetical protein
MRIACLQVRPFLRRGHSFLLTGKQFAPQVGDVDNNLNRADAVLSKANPKNLDLLVLPELAFSGRSCPACDAAACFCLVVSFCIGTSTCPPATNAAFRGWHDQRPPDLDPSNVFPGIRRLPSDYGY